MESKRKNDENKKTIISLEGALKTAQERILTLEAQLAGATKAVRAFISHNNVEDPVPVRFLKIR